MAFTRTVTVTGGNLFHIALLELGDARQAYRLAQLNNITDWFLPDGVIRDLQIPPADFSLTSGFPEQ